MNHPIVKAGLVAVAFLLLLAACTKDMPAPGEPAARYANKVFAEIEETTVTYSSVYNLRVDVFSPKGDAETNRPIIVLAHGGGFSAGNRNNPETRYWAQELAKRGYVTASISYRLALTALDMLDSAKAISQVIKAVSDGRAAVRYFRQSAANGNPFGIDPNRIIVGGTSAGAVLFAHQAYLRDTVEAEPHIRYFMNINGGLEGNSGNPGISDEVLACINLAGGIYSTGYISTSEAPLLSIHGDQDGTVPYGCDDVFQSSTGGLDLINLCGSGEMHPAALAQGIRSELWTLTGQDHVPWATANGMVEPLSSDMEKAIADFLYEEIQ